MFEPIRKQKKMNWKQYEQFKRNKKKAKKHVYYTPLRTA